ncbi:MAG: DedA family protein [Actinomycetota bacterium]|jgi:membrane-associated protein|nr:DedA family protein [Actinomycetota bacterium]
MEAITGIWLVDWFLSLLDGWGYLVTFAATIIENLFVIGSFTPGETVVMAASFVSSQGNLVLPLVWISSVVGTVAGSNISYFFGRMGGRDALLRYGHKLRIGEDKIAEAERYFNTHGSETVFVARFAAGFKNFVPVIAGASRMHLGWFEGYTVVGAMTYTSIMCAIGYFLGENFDLALKIASRLGYAGTIVFALVILFLLFGGRVLNRRHSEHTIAEADADAGPDDSGESEAAHE